MSSNPAQQDPSIEEILASIRQIITDDDQKAGEPAPTAASEPAPEPAAVANDEVPSAEDVFELVDRVVADEDVPPPPSTPAEPAAVDPFDILPPAPEPTPAPAPLPPRTTTPPEVDVFTEKAALATESAFAKLSETIVLERQRAIAGASVTLEDIVKELLQPILRGWVDEHMPSIAERLVREELEKISRAAREG